MTTTNNNDDNDDDDNDDDISSMREILTLQNEYHLILSAHLFFTVEITPFLLGMLFSDSILIFNSMCIYFCFFSH